jgi:transglutaminase-like putative cysteine protease
MDEYLKSTFFLDWESDTVREFAREAAGKNTAVRRKAINLFYAVRDEIRYDPYNIDLSRGGFRASTIIKKQYGYCVAKAVVLCAAARACGIPSRLGFADVRNHLTTERLKELMKTDVFVFHGYSEIFIEGKWVKATPTFNLSLCKRFGVKALDFDGMHDALLHPFDSKGQKHMEYVKDHGSFADVPHELIVEKFRTHYPMYFEKKELAAGDFEKEAETENRHDV